MDESDFIRPKIEPETWTRLRDYQRHPNESMDAVINRVLDHLNERPELVADGGATAEAVGDEEPGLDEWMRNEFPAVSGRQTRSRIEEIERDRRAAIERAESAEAEAQRLRRQIRQLEAQPATSLTIGGTQLGPAGTAGVFTATALLGVGIGRASK